MYIGEIKLFAGKYVPSNFVRCDGRLLDESELLFELIGHHYDPDPEDHPGKFRVPDLRGRVPVHRAVHADIGSSGGAETVTLKEAELPAHSHAMRASSATAASPDPAGHVVAQSITAGADLYLDDDASKDLAASAVTSFGESSPQPHANVQPFGCLQYVIVAYGGEHPFPDRGKPTHYEPILGEVRALPYDLHRMEPGQWMPCDGRYLATASNTALHDVLGGAYGERDDAFALPNLEGCVIVGAGDGPGLTSRARGDRGGEETATIDPARMPTHAHRLRAAPGFGERPMPEGNTLARYTNAYQTHATSNLVSMAPETLAHTGGGAPHTNMQPYLALQFCICVAGSLTVEPDAA